jgi:exodeoxyribonuclease V beta subunit
VFPGAERRALQARRLQGMLTGFMDLVVHHAGRYWIVDYKSNWLPDYEAQTLQDTVLHHRYEVQYVLYTLALHRLLKLRLPDYNYERDVGGAVYLFLRGIDAPGSGVHLHRPAWTLIKALDQALQQELPA